MLAMYSPIVDERPDRCRTVGRGNRLTGKHPDLFRVLTFIQTGYEIYTNVLYRLIEFACIGAAGQFSKQETGDRKMYGTGLFYLGISANSRFPANDYQ